MKDLVYEIGVEEVPAGYIQSALDQLKNAFCKKAGELNIAFGKVDAKGTPRRLCLLVENIEEKQADIREELLGPSKSAGIDSSGKFTKAAEGFARSKNADTSLLTVVDTPKGEYLQLVREVAGRPVMELLPELLKGLILDISFPKSMRWGANQHSFARPIQWLVALFGKDVIGFEHEGVISGNMSRGHRFMNDYPVVIPDMQSYEKTLGDHNVLVDMATRRAAVVNELIQSVDQSTLPDSAKVTVDEELVDVVTNLVEMPYGVCGSFAEKFLQLPPDVLITSMREHQKSFPVAASATTLHPAFVAVNNTKVIDPAVTRKGHERVLRARLEDALFFFNEDRQAPLEKYCSRLEGIVFQAKLGTMLEKSGRVVKLAKMLAEKLEPSHVDTATRAAQLCKADLMTSMVGEFPSLQGTMGAAYAVHSGETADVALAIQEHYMPKRAGADLPTSAAGALVGLADRIDTIAGCFGIGQIPTGTADPFGLRRLSLALLHIVADRKYRLSLREIFRKALMLYGDKVDASAATVDAIVTFIRGRFENDEVSKGREAGIVEAVTSIGFDDICDTLARIESFASIRKEDAFAVLAASYKRIRNIIKENSNTSVDESVFETDAEKNLYSIYLTVRGEMQIQLGKKEYSQALRTMLQMKEPVDRFFDDVMVMADDLAVRANRLNLLTAIAELILQIGDISKI